MSPTTYIPIIILLLLLSIMVRRSKAAAAIKAIKKRKTEGSGNMKELAKRFIGKKCIIIAFDGSRQYDGVVREVSDNALLLEKNGQLEALNLDFVMKIKEQLEKKKRKQ